MFMFGLHLVAAVASAAIAVYAPAPIAVICGLGALMYGVAAYLVTVK